MLRPVLVLAVFSLFFSESIRAQEAIGLQVSGLTSAERDSISLHRSGPEELHLVYACVPAGILVFGSGHSGGTRAVLRSQAIQAMAAIIPAERISPSEWDIQAAESACQAARDQ